MSRPSTGAVCTYEVLRIELGSLLKNQYIQPGYKIESIYTWTKKWRSQPNGEVSASVKMHTMLLADSSSGTITLDYKEGETVRQDNIQLVSVPSNLGKGNVVYFLCPQTGRRSRVLYRCYGSPIWKSREAYEHRIYYECQHSSKMNHANDRWWYLEQLIPKINASKRKQHMYNGKQTRRSQRTHMLLNKQAKAEKIRWSAESMPASMRGFCKQYMP